MPMRTRITWQQLSVLPRETGIVAILENSRYEYKESLHIALTQMIFGRHGQF